MNILFPKVQKVCATCTYWNGAKEIYGSAIKAHFTANGICEHADNLDIEEQTTATESCLKHTLNPALY
jgi:hypothetical protein